MICAQQDRLPDILSASAALIVLLQSMRHILCFDTAGVLGATVFLMIAGPVVVCCVVWKWKKGM